MQNYCFPLLPGPGGVVEAVTNTDRSGHLFSHYLSVRLFDWTVFIHVLISQQLFLLDDKKLNVAFIIERL